MSWKFKRVGTAWKQLIHVTTTGYWNELTHFLTLMQRKNLNVVASNIQSAQCIFFQSFNCFFKIIIIATMTQDSSKWVTTYNLLILHAITLVLRVELYTSLSSTLGSLVVVISLWGMQTSEIDWVKLASGRHSGVFLNYGYS